MASYKNPVILMSYASDDLSAAFWWLQTTHLKTLIHYPIEKCNILQWFSGGFESLNAYLVPKC